MGIWRIFDVEIEDDDDVMMMAQEIRWLSALAMIFVGTRLLRVKTPSNLLD